MHEKLIKYLEEIGISHNCFSRKIKSSPTTVNRILKDKQMPSLKLGIRIHRWTKGEVSVFDWDSDDNQQNNTSDKTRKKHK